MVVMALNIDKEMKDLLTKDRVNKALLGRKK